MSAAKKGGLGRGFDSLIPTDLFDDSFDPTSAQDHQVSKEKTLPLSAIHANPDQPRRVFDEEALNELAGSVKEHGVLQPIIVTPKDGGYAIVAGERRYRAAKLAGLTEVPVVVRSLSDQHQLEISLIENIQRRDLNTIETATAYAKLRDQFNLSNDEIAARVHKSAPAVINTMRLLKLPKEVVQLIAEGKLTEGQARPLIGLEPEVLAEVVPRIVAEGWTTRKVEQFIANRRNAGHENDVADDRALEREHEARIEAIRTRLNAPVDLRVNSRGAGKIVISFKSTEEFERIQKLLGS